MSQDKVMIRYWVQDTMESGHWQETDLVARNIAENMLKMDIFEMGEIITPDHTKPS